MHVAYDDDTSYSTRHKILNVQSEIMKILLNLITDA